LGSDSCVSDNSGLRDVTPCLWVSISGSFEVLGFLALEDKGSDVLLIFWNHLFSERENRILNNICFSAVRIIALK
jgi:hypothetical protein